MSNTTHAQIVLLTGVKLGTPLWWPIVGAKFADSVGAASVDYQVNAGEERMTGAGDGRSRGRQALAADCYKEK